MALKNQQSLDLVKMVQQIEVQGQPYHYASLAMVGGALGADLDRRPFTYKVLAENVLRRAIQMPLESSLSQDVLTQLLAPADPSHRSEVEFYPARVLMQDFTGVPAMVDLAAMRDALFASGNDPARIDPQVAVDLVIDHSVMVDHYGTKDAWELNTAMEYQRNRERYAFLRWSQENFKNFRVIPPESGICHQVNLEYLAKVVAISQKGDKWWAFPDTLVGTDSHTTMVNGLAVLGWGVGGIEAEAAILGEPISLLLPQVVGVKVYGRLRPGVTATDLVLTVTQRLRAMGVVDKFVEFFGDGLDQLALADRATISNMAPEYGATCGFFPIDRQTLQYLELTGRSPHEIALVETYAKVQGLWRKRGAAPTYDALMALNLEEIEPSLAGPKRPQDRVALREVARSFEREMKITNDVALEKMLESPRALMHGDIVIGAITSCTNTSNPHVMVAAGLLARKARERSLKVKPWVKTSLSPGSMAVTSYLAASGLDADLEALGFYLTGYGCSTCIGNSGPLDPEVAEAIDQKQLVVGAVLSGNRNFEGRIHSQVQANYLASPPLVVAYALAGNLFIDLATQPLGVDGAGRKVYLKDIWPAEEEINQVLASVMGPEIYLDKYRGIDHGDDAWRSLPSARAPRYAWEDQSTYIKRPPYFSDPAPRGLADIKGARVLLLLGDSVTTDHISPAGSIKKSSPAGRYLMSLGVAEEDFNSYGARRGNHEVMMRGTFANIRLSNFLVPGVAGGVTRIAGESRGEAVAVFDAAMRYKESQIPLIIMAGKEYGTGSSRDWAAKGTALLGVRAVIAESFERIHRANLVGMGVIPLQFDDLHACSWRTLKLTGDESFDLCGVVGCQPGGRVILKIGRPDGVTHDEVALRLRIDTQKELDMVAEGGLLAQALKRFL